LIDIGVLLVERCWNFCAATPEVSIYLTFNECLKGSAAGDEAQHPRLPRWRRFI